MKSYVTSNKNVFCNIIIHMKAFRCISIKINISGLNNNKINLFYNSFVLLRLDYVIFLDSYYVFLRGTGNKISTCGYTQEKTIRRYKCFTVYWMLIFIQKAVDCKLSSAHLDISYNYLITLQRSLAIQVKTFQVIKKTGNANK